MRATAYRFFLRGISATALAVSRECTVGRVIEYLTIESLCKTNFRSVFNNAEHRHVNADLKSTLESAPSMERDAEIDGTCFGLASAYDAQRGGTNAAANFFDGIAPAAIPSLVFGTCSKQGNCARPM